jgi:hypothetical protein
VVTDTGGRTLVRELAERIVIAVAPDEIEMFPALAEVYEAKPEAFLSRHGGRDEPLGFGLGDVGALVTPAAFFVAGLVANYVTERFVDGVVQHGKPLLARLFRRWWKKERRPATTVTLTAEQADEVRQVTLEKAREAGLPDATASVVADAVIGALYLGSTRLRNGHYQ